MMLLAQVFRLKLTLIEVISMAQACIMGILTRVKLCPNWDASLCLVIYLALKKPHLLKYGRFIIGSVVSVA